MSSGGVPVDVVAAVKRVLQQLMGPERYSQAELELCLEWCLPFHSGFQELLESRHFMTYQDPVLCLLDGGRQK